MFLTLCHISAMCFVFSAALNEANLEKNVFFIHEVIINGMLSITTQLYHQLIIIM